MALYLASNSPYTSHGVELQEKEKSLKTFLENYSSP